MENIFIVTDFSIASRNAALYGVELAKFLGSKVFLFHAYQPAVQIPESYILYDTKSDWETIKKLLEEEAAAIDPGKTLAIEICASDGIPATAILDNARMHKANLIICGMKTTIKGLRRIFGSTTTALTKTSNIPFLVIPADATFSKPSHIALANDMDADTSPATIEVLKEISKAFQAKLSVVWVLENEAEESYKMRLQGTGISRHLKDLKPVMEFPTGGSIASVLDNYAKENATDMMAIIPHKHNFIERLFIESTTNNLIFHTHIPLLVLPQQKQQD